MPKDKKTIITSGPLPVDLSGGEEWLGSGVVFKGGVHRVHVEGFVEAESRTKKPMFTLMLKVESGPDGGTEDAGKMAERNFMADTEEGLNFLRGFFARIFGENWREEVLDAENAPLVEKIYGAAFDVQFTTNTYMDDRGKERNGYDIDLSTLENVELPAAKAKPARRPAR